MCVPPRQILLLLSLAATGCVGGGALPPLPSPAEIPGLEATYARDPGDFEMGVRLATAYREAARQEDAGVLVAELLESAPRDAGLLVLTGLLSEDAGDWASARAAYESVLSDRPRGALRSQLERRLDFVRTEELRADVRGALLREAQLAQTAPDPTTVGVFPFVYEGDDPTWAPLSLALAELLATDLGVTGRLRVLERIRVQTLLSELALSEAGRTDPATGARSGRILGSGHVVQGRYRVDDSARISIDAVVVEVLAGAEQVVPITVSDLMERFFDLEKQLAFDTHAELGIQLTAAERERINERQTESVEALLAFGEGLAAQDAGNFALADQRFAEAEALDPSFSAASASRQEVASTQAAAALPSASEMSATAQQASQQKAAVQGMSSVPPSVPGTVQNVGAPPERSVLAEVTGNDRIGQVILLELIFRRPGGGE